MKRLGSSIGLILILALAALGLQLYRKTAECRNHAQRADALYSQAKSWEKTANDCALQVDSLQRRIFALTLPAIPSHYIREFQERGLQEPVADLVSDLQAHPELIPYPGLGGSKMGFNGEDQIRVLNETWVYAGFDDGHIGGDGLYAYTVAPGGKISWRVIDSKLKN